MWEQIRSNQIRSRFVVGGMGALLVAMGAAGGGMLLGEGGLVPGAVIAVVLWLILWVTTKTSGDNIMLGMARARKIERKDHPMLVNVVDEMTIAAQLPKRPDIYIVDDPSPNAFATGQSPDKASVAVTTGLLRTLNRAELQGVVAHELGHIKNRDVALITTAGIMMGVIVMIAEIAMRVLWHGGGRRSRSSNKEDGAAQIVILIISLVLLILAPLLAQLIYFALSRKREYLADASGALFTRYPEGLASALEKIAYGGRERLALADESKVTAPMYIVRPLKAGEKAQANSSFATHPPIEKRIAILRGLSGDVSYRAYESAYRKMTGKSVMGARSLAESSTVAPLVGAPPADEPKLDTTVKRRRAASDAFLTASKYTKRECPGCSAILKVPPELASRVTECPRCRTAL